MANMTTEFMALWDGISTDQNVRVMVLAATNRPSELDEAILRRLPQAFDIGMPDRKEKYEILKVDIFELCEKATYFPIREILEKEGKGRPCPVPRPLSQLDLEKVLDWIWRKFLLCRRRRKLQQASTVG
uniref:ATPase AAA-type core domain-containing protein n=1 Tax=Brassica campestris TaxID=3711 RepID=M4DDY4_BRACM